MADQTARLEAATVRAEVGSSILYRFSNDGASEDPIPTASGDITNLKKVILDIQTEGANKISFATQIYATTAAGIAATTSGAIFLVRSSDPDEIYAVYSNNAGTAVDTGKRALSATAVQAATDAASAAAASAQAAATTATARVAGFHSPSATDPTSRDDGSALQIGDTYFNTAAQTNKVFSTTGWVIASVSGVDLNAAIATREPTLPTGSAGQYLDGTKTFQPLNKAAVGLSNVDNTSDLAKPLSTAATTALNLKAPIASPTFTGTVGGITKSMVGLAAVDNTSDAAKPVSTAQQAALDTKQGLAANLTALAGLSGLADRFAYFTAAGAMALATISAQGRTFLAASTAALQRTALGLGTAAVFNTRALASEIVTPVTNDDGYNWGFNSNGASVNGNGNAFNYYQLNISNDSAVQQTGLNGATGSKVNGLNVLMNSGGSTARGGRHAIQAKFLQGYGGPGPTDAGNLDRFYVGVQGQCLSDTGDGGTSTSDQRGAYFGISSSVAISGSAKYVANVTSCEFNTEIQVGTGVSAGVRCSIHTGIQIASFIGERGYGLDCAVSISNLGGSPRGWKNAIALHGLNGGPALENDSTILKVFPSASGTASIDTVIDVTGLTCAALLRSTSVTLTDTGLNINKAGAFLSMGSTVAGTVTQQFRTSGTASAYDCRWNYSQGSATAGQGIAQLEAQGLITPLIRPFVDNTQSLGLSNFRWSTVYAGTGTINTSDAREKTEVRRLEDRELDAAKLLGKEIGAFQFLEAIKAKGDDARLHIGMTVQRAIEVMEGCGLDPINYAFICYDEWEATDEVTSEDEEGNITIVSPATEAGDRYGFRMDQLLAFIAAGFEARLSDLESR